MACPPRSRESIPRRRCTWSSRQPDPRLRDLRMRPREVIDDAVTVIGADVDAVPEGSAFRSLSWWTGRREDEEDTTVLERGSTPSSTTAKDPGTSGNGISSGSGSRKKRAKGVKIRTSGRCSPINSRQISTIHRCGPGDAVTDREGRGECHGGAGSLRGAGRTNFGMKDEDVEPLLLHPCRVRRTRLRHHPGTTALCGQSPGSMPDAYEIAPAGENQRSRRRGSRRHLREFAG